MNSHLTTSAKTPCGSHPPQNTRPTLNRLTAQGLLLLAAAWCALTVCAQSQISGLWGKDGELWSPESRLPDFSFAGY